MSNLLLSAANLKLLKDQIRAAYKVPSSHLSEAIAAALGFGSNAALLAHLKTLTGEPPSMPLSDQVFLERLDVLGSPIDEWRGFASFRSQAVAGEPEQKFQPKWQSPFRAVHYLWIVPNLDRVHAGKRPLHFVDHDFVDFEYLRSVIADEFRRNGSPFEIRLGNDTIDQVTVNARKQTETGKLIKCQDFADILLSEARKQTAPIIDIRKQWAMLHQLPDRRHALPAVIVPIVVESYDAEDGILWPLQARLRLGIKPAHPDHALTPPHLKNEDDQQGYLPYRLQKNLAKCFHTPYQPFCVLARAASDPLPPELGSARIRLAVQW